MPGPRSPDVFCVTFQKRMDDKIVSMESQRNQLACDVGSGNTRPEALEELRKNLERFKAARSELPRPGTNVPIEFAASDGVGQHAELAKDFFRRILEFDWAWIPMSPVSGTSMVMKRMTGL
jgi:hypothetical protein